MDEDLVSSRIAIKVYTSEIGYLESSFEIILCRIDRMIIYAGLIKAASKTYAQIPIT